MCVSPVRRGVDGLVRQGSTPKESVVNISVDTQDLECPRKHKYKI